jgi:hypothetical protein
MKITIEIDGDAAVAITTETIKCARNYIRRNRFPEAGDDEIVDACNVLLKYYGAEPED